MQQPPPLPQQPPQQPPQQTILLRCERCKGELHAEAKVCPHCGLWRNPEEYATGFCSIYVILLTIFVFLPVIAVVVFFLICAIFFLITGGSLFYTFMEP